MYKQHFGFSQKPFNLVPDSNYLYLSPDHQRALTMLEYGIMSNAGFTVITGEIGAGKTTLIRTLLHKLDSDVVVGLINNTHESFGQLMEWVLDSLEISSEAKDNSGRYRDFINFVLEQHGQGKRVVLIVDEAQNLSIKSLEELRLLSNVNIDSDIFLQLILTGQPELIDKLNDPRLEQFSQRIGVEFHLKALNFVETKKYINHRLSIAGATSEIFTETALAVIFVQSQGVPRKINTLCDMALVFAFSYSQDIVDEKIALEMINERKSNSIIRQNEKQNPEVDAVKKWLLEQKNIDLS